MRSLPDMRDNTYTFIDVETTGGNPNSDRITEIGIVRIENGIKVAEFQSLVNPQQHIPHYIQQLTGINQEMTKNAPLFEDIKHKVNELLRDTIFVAHNAAFDYSFIKSEFKRLDDTYRSKLLCTVRLSRALYPDFRSHNLSSIIERFGISVESRHRAFDDAYALWDFFGKARRDVGDKVFFDTIKSIVKGPRLPSTLREKQLGPFPSTPGIYKFYGESTPLFTNSELLYVGKSNSLKKRIYSHFTVGSQSKLDIELIRYTSNIEVQQTAGILSAELLEAQLIKTEKPLLNKALRKTSQPIYVYAAEKDGYMTLKSTDDPEWTKDNSNKILARFSSKLTMKSSLRELAETYNLCPQLLGLENSKGACFWYQIDKCKGACCGNESALSYNIRFAESFARTKVLPWPYDGVIAITERSADIEEIHVFDDWCYIAHVIKSSDSDAVLTEFEKQFDWDIYKIVSKIITKKSGVSVLPREWRDYLSSSTSYVFHDI